MLLSKDFVSPISLIVLGIVWYTVCPAQEEQVTDPRAADLAVAQPGTMLRILKNLYTDSLNRMAAHDAASNEYVAIERGGSR